MYMAQKVGLLGKSEGRDPKEKCLPTGRWLPFPGKQARNAILSTKLMTGVIKKSKLKVGLREKGGRS